MILSGVEVVATLVAAWRLDLDDEVVDTELISHQAVCFLKDELLLAELVRNALTVVFKLYMDCKGYLVLADLPAVEVVGRFYKLDFFELLSDLVCVDVLRGALKECYHACPEGLNSRYEGDC